MKIKVFVIDPFSYSVQIAYVKQDDIRDIYQLGSFTTFCCGATFPNGDTIYVDDEGLFKPHQRFFKVIGYKTPLAGKGVMIGTNMKTGRSQPVQMSLEFLRNKILWEPAGFYLI